MKTSIKNSWLLIIGIALLSCKRKDATIVKKIVLCDTITIVSFSKNIQPIFNAHCIDGGCHSGSNPAAKLNLQSSVSYIQLMKRGSGYVDTVNPNYSLLYSQMNSVSQPMPPSGKLDDCTLNLVLKWIQQKAKNN